MKINAQLVAGLAMLGLVLGGGGFLLAHRTATDSRRPHGLMCSAGAATEIGGPIAFTDDHGRARTEADLKGKPTLLFFGFTACPDVCPLTLQYLGRVIETQKLPAGAFNIVMASLDPERDTPEVLGRYVASGGFPPGLIGARIPPEKLNDIVKSFAATYRKTSLPDSALGYTIDHTALVYLMDRNWRLKTFFTPEDEPADVARCVREAIGGAARS